jgi:hypothetical protein
MRLAIAFAAMMVLAVTGTQGQTPSVSGKGGPTDDAVLNVIGDRLVRVFTQFGVPENVYPVRQDDNPDDDTVVFHYASDSYGFAIHNKTVSICFFWGAWTGTVKGIKIGDSRDAVVKVLGNPSVTLKDANGVITSYGWDLKDLDAKLYADFDANGIVNRVDAELN